MTDTERLNLIEHYKWRLELIDDTSTLNGLWQIKGQWGYVHGRSVRAVVDSAISAQFKWSTG